MRFYQPPKFQLIGFLLSMPFICWAINLILYGQRVYSDWRVLAVSFPLVFALGFGSWYMHFQYSNAIRRKFPEIPQTGKRVLSLLTIFIFVMTPSVLVIFFIYDLFSILGYKLSFEDMKLGLILGFVVNVIFETLWEVLYIIEKYKENLAEKELLEQ